LEEQFTQVGVRLFFARIGPELESEVLARLGRLAMEQ